MPRIVRAAALIIVAAVVGYLLARSAGSDKTSSDALSQTATQATFRVAYPGDWTTTEPSSLPGLSLAETIGLRPSDSSAARMAIGTAKATTVGTLPAAFLASLPDRPKPQTVALGAYRLDRYLDLKPHGAGRVVSVYLLATTRSTVVATCSTPHRDDTFTAECERVLGTLRLAKGVKVSGGVDPAYALELNTILATLDMARKTDGPGLLASSLTERARAARRLSSAESTAAASAHRLSAGSAASANATLVASLRQAARGYRALAAAADGHDQSGYEAAQGMLESAQQKLEGAFKTLARLGYQLR